MTENEALKLMESIQISHDCEMIKTLDFQGTVIRALETLQQYKAIGTVKGYERAIQSSIENYNLYREYKAKVQEYEAIGTVEEFNALKEKSVAKKPIVKKDAYGDIDAYYCPDCGCYIRSTMTRREIILEENLYCGGCGQKLDWH